MRGKILPSLMIIGFALLVGVSGGLAYFHDSAGTTGSFQAGTLELDVSSEGMWDMDLDHWEDESEDGLITMALDDVKPGDYGFLNVGVQVVGNSAYGQIVLENVFVENDLDEALKIDAEWWNEEESEPICEMNDLAVDNKYIPLPGTSSDYYVDIEPCDTIPALEPGKEYVLVIEVEFPIGLDNVNQYQGGQLEFNLGIEVEQARHNFRPFEWEVKEPPLVNLTTWPDDEAIEQGDIIALGGMEGLTIESKAEELFVRADLVNSGSNSMTFDLGETRTWFRFEHEEPVGYEITWEEDRDEPKVDINLVSVGPIEA